MLNREKQMKDEQTKTIIKQWLLPTFLLVAVLLVMLFNFSAKSSQTAADGVENNLIHTAEEYALQINHKLVCMADAGKPVGYLMKGYIKSNKRLMIEMADALCFSTEAYAVVYYSQEGAFVHDGTKLDLSGLSYYEELQKVFGDISKTSDDVAVRYIYVQDDEVGFGRNAIVAVVSVDNRTQGDKLLLYYSTEKMKQLFNTDEFDADSFYVVMDSQGEIIQSSGVQSGFVKTGNLWDAVRDSISEDTVFKTTVRMRNDISGSIEAEADGEERTLVYAPVGINDWMVVIGVNQSYADALMNREWRNARNMIYQLMAAVVAFLIMIVVVNIISRSRSRQESMALEKKADTDLLTGLTNKLATERKIKEYIKAYPNEQALMFILDVDNFKKINDTMGHAFGDEVLRSLGHSLGALFRASDVVGRAGGDEFIILLKHIKDDVILEKEAKKLCDFFKDFQAGEYVKYAVTASIGAAVFPKDGKDFDSIYKAADSALYVSKKRGKAQLAFYGDEDTKSEGKKKVEAESRVRE